MRDFTITDLLRALADQDLTVSGIDTSETTTESGEINLDDIARPEAFAKRYPDVVGSPSRLRYLLRHRDGNGLTESGAVVERGRSLYIIKPLFLDWLVRDRA